MNYNCYHCQILCLLLLIWTSAISTFLSDYSLFLEEQVLHLSESVQSYCKYVQLKIMCTDLYTLNCLIITSLKWLATLLVQQRQPVNSVLFIYAIILQLFHHTSPPIGEDPQGDWGGPSTAKSRNGLTTTCTITSQGMKLCTQTKTEPIGDGLQSTVLQPTNFHHHDDKN